MQQPKLEVATSTEIKLEKGIEPPKKYSGGGRYPWEKMEVGDSFALPAEVEIAAGYSVALAASRRLAPKKFKCSYRRGIAARIWRVE